MVALYFSRSSRCTSTCIGSGAGSPCCCDADTATYGKNHKDTKTQRFFSIIVQAANGADYIRLRMLMLLSGPALQLIRRHVFDMRGDMPGVAKRIFEAARSITIKLILHRPGELGPGSYSAVHKSVDI